MLEKILKIDNFQYMYYQIFKTPKIGINGNFFLIKMIQILSNRNPKCKVRNCQKPRFKMKMETESKPAQKSAHTVHVVNSHVLQKSNRNQIELKISQT